MSLLKIKNLSKSFLQGEKKIQVLKNLNFELPFGGTASIIGRSGSGKSTLLSLFAGLDRPDEGHLEFSAENLGLLSEEALTSLRNGKIGIIFQQFHLISHLTAFENICLPLEIQRESNVSNTSSLSYAEMKKKGLFFAEKVGLSARLDHLPGQLSGGEKQRVAIARSLIIKPELLLADEPSGSLDDETGDAIMELIFRLVQEEKTGLVLVTHNKELAKKCDKLWSLTSGSLSSEVDSAY